MARLSANPTRQGPPPPPGRAAPRPPASLKDREPLLPNDSDAETPAPRKVALATTSDTRSYLSVPSRLPRRPRRARTGKSPNGQPDITGGRWNERPTDITKGSNIASSPVSPPTQTSASSLASAPGRKNLDKPLPSPPFAQVINPASPVKANRTLIDATVKLPEGGSGASATWPVMRPEDSSTGSKITDASMSEPQFAPSMYPLGKPPIETCGRASTNSLPNNMPKLPKALTPSSPEESNSTPAIKVKSPSNMTLSSDMLDPLGNELITNDVPVRRKLFSRPVAVDPECTVQEEEHDEDSGISDDDIDVPAHIPREHLENIGWTVKKVKPIRAMRPSRSNDSEVAMKTPAAYQSGHPDPLRSSPRSPVSASFPSGLTPTPSVDARDLGFSPRIAGLPKPIKMQSSPTPFRGASISDDHLKEAGEALKRSRPLVQNSANANASASPPVPRKSSIPLFKRHKSSNFPKPMERLPTPRSLLSTKGAEEAESKASKGGFKRGLRQLFHKNEAKTPKTPNASNSPKRSSIPTPKKPSIMHRMRTSGGKSGPQVGKTAATPPAQKEGQGRNVPASAPERLSKSPETLAKLELITAVIEAIENRKKAEIAAEKTENFAREARMHAEMTRLAEERILKMVGPELATPEGIKAFLDGLEK